MYKEAKMYFKKFAKYRELLQGHPKITLTESKLHNMQSKQFSYFITSWKINYNLRIQDYHHWVNRTNFLTDTGSNSLYFPVP